MSEGLLKQLKEQGIKFASFDLDLRDCSLPHDDKIKKVNEIFLREHYFPLVTNSNNGLYSFNINLKKK